MAEVYLTSWLETARDKLKALLDALKTTMASGYDPTFGYVYEYHNVANLQLNAVTIGLDTVEAETEGMSSSGDVVQYLMAFTLRVHTAYQGGIMDDQKNARLLNSIANKLKANRSLGDDYFIRDVGEIRSSEEFAESATVGGQLSVIIEKNHIHDQE